MPLDVITFSDSWSRGIVTTLKLSIWTSWYHYKPECRVSKLNTSIQKQTHSAIFYIFLDHKEVSCIYILLICLTHNDILIVQLLREGHFEIQQYQLNRWKARSNMLIKTELICIILLTRSSWGWFGWTIWFITGIMTVVVSITPGSQGDALSTPTLPFIPFTTCRIINRY